MDDFAAGIDVEKSTLGVALKSRSFRIPNYQREYSWEKDRVLKLFEDFNRAIPRGSAYFLGTIVLTPGNPLNVIDGQQRLATTTIFLAAVRDAFLTLGKEADAKAIEDEFLFTYNRRKKEYNPKLTLNIDDREYMMDRVLTRPIDRKKELNKRYHSHRLIDQAARLAAERVAKIAANSDTDTGKVDAFDNWIEFLEDKAVVVMLTPPNPSHAYQMFKTMNDRAQRTTQADMIKNHLFEQAGDRVDEAQSKWSIMRSSIEGVFHGAEVDPLLTYLHHVSILLYGPIKSDDIFDKMEQEVSGPNQALQFSEALATLANDYAAILNPTHPKWGTYQQQVRTYVDQIAQQIRMSFIRPLMLAVAAKFSVSETQKAFRLLASWVVRFLIAGGSRSGVVEEAFGNTSHRIRIGEIETARQLADAAGHVVPNDPKFHGAFSRKSLAPTKQARFILRELEMEARGGSPDEVLEVVSDTNSVSLEHVLPKNPACPGWGHFSADERRAYCNRLGNLILMKARDNGAINDKPFSQKRPVIERSSNILLTADVIERTKGDPNKWTMDLIEQRQTYLADLAVKRWPRSLK